MVIGVTLGVLVAIGLVFSFYRDHQDRKLVYEFLKTSRETTDYKFRSTYAIASGTNLTESRVEKAASSHPKIRRNKGERPTWILVD